MWVLRHFIPYTYDMTLVAAIISKKGITCIGEGRVKDDTGNIVTDKQIKLFELSPYCVVMPSGAFFENCSEAFAHLKGAYAKGNITDVEEIANEMCRGFKEIHGVTSGGEVYALIFVGYSLQNGVQVPRIMRALSTDFLVFERNEPYCAEGLNDIAECIFEKEYSTYNAHLRNTNYLAIKAMLETKREHCGDVNGDIALWNILPTGRIKKYDKAGIKKLIEKQTAK